MIKQLDTIRTKRLILRGINETDAEFIVRLRSDPKVYMYFTSPHRITIQEHQCWYHNSYLRDKNRFDWIGIEETTGDQIGVFGLKKGNQYSEISYIIAPDYQQRGFATEGLKSLFEYTVRTWSTKRFLAQIHEENKASIALVKKLGFVLLYQKNSFQFYEAEV